MKRQPIAGFDQSLRLPLALSARLANIFYTSQVQAAYAVAERARESAERAMDTIAGTWPCSPLRDWTLAMVRAQAGTAECLAQDVLERARRRCGLAFAPVAGCARPH